METTIDSLGRIVIPKALRDAVGLTPGMIVDLSRYGAGLQLVPAGRTALLVEVDGALVAESTTQVTDDIVFGQTRHALGTYAALGAEVEIVSG